MRLWERICEDLGKTLRIFMRLWERICEDSQDFQIHEFGRICETLGEDS